MNPSKQSVNQGNYYRSGIDRVIAQLRQMNVAIPDGALQPTSTMPKELVALPHLQVSSEFSPLDHSILDRFEGRDYLLAQQLLHPSKEGSNEWHAIGYPEHIDEQSIRHYVLSPSLLDATAVAIARCDKDGVRIDSVESLDGNLVLRAGQGIAALIKPIVFEPFSLANRDRVRTAFKHVRLRSNPELVQSRVKKLPGFETAGFALESYRAGAPEGCLFFGFPSNWAGAMKNALADVGVEVKLHQAQELVACFFGAASWHQLTARQDDELPVLTPTCVSWTEEGGRQFRYFRTTEEAIFAVGQHIASEQADVVVDHCSLALLNYPATFSCTKRSVFEATPVEERYGLDHYIECGWEDVDDASSCTDGVIMAAERLLKSIAKNASNPAQVLCPEEGTLNRFIAAQERAGIRRENIVPVGDYLLSFDMTDEPRQRDYLFIHKMDGNAVVTLAEGIALYKASMKFSASEQTLTILAEYQSKVVATIPVPDAEVLTTIRSITDKSIGHPMLEMQHGDIRFH